MYTASGVPVPQTPTGAYVAYGSPTGSQSKIEIAQGSVMLPKTTSTGSSSQQLINYSEQAIVMAHPVVAVQPVQAPEAGNLYPVLHKSSGSSSSH